MDNAIADNLIDNQVHMDRPDTEITGPPSPEIPRPERPETPPPPTFIIDGIAIPADDVELIFDDDIIAGYVNENATITNMEDQEATIAGGDQQPDNAGNQEPVNAADQIPDNAGDQAPSRSVRSQIRDRTSLIQNNPRDTVIDGAGILLGSLAGNKYPGTSASNKIVKKLKLVKERVVYICRDMSHKS